MTNEKVRDVTDNRPHIESQGGASVGDVAPRAPAVMDTDRSRSCPS